MPGLSSALVRIPYAFLHGPQTTAVESSLCDPKSEDDPYRSGALDTGAPPFSTWAIATKAGYEVLTNAIRPKDRLPVGASLTPFVGVNRPVRAH